MGFECMGFLMFVSDGWFIIVWLYYNWVLWGREDDWDVVLGLISECDGFGVVYIGLVRFVCI